MWFSRNCIGWMGVAALLVGQSSKCRAAPDSASKTAPSKTASRVQTGGRKAPVPAPTHSQRLVEAVQKNNLAAVQALLNQGTNPNARNAMGSPVLMVAANRGYLSIVQALLAHKASLNLHSYNKEGSTALLEAVVYDRVGIVKLLLSHKAKVDEPYGGGIFQGTTPLMMAIMSSTGTKVLMPLLIEAGANVNASDAQGDTVLHQVAAFGTVEAAQLLLEKGATVDARNSLGMTPLMNAVSKGDAPMVKLFISKGANVNARGDAARRAYGRAAFMGDTATMQKLEKSGRLNTLHEDDASVLDWAMSVGQKPEIITLLKQAGATRTQ